MPALKSQLPSCLPSPPHPEALNPLSPKLSKLDPCLNSTPQKPLHISALNPEPNPWPGDAGDAGEGDGDGGGEGEGGEGGGPGGRGGVGAE